MSEARDTEVVVVQPDEGESFWQPVPANGYAEIRVSHRRHPAIRNLATGIQVIAPGCHIREHVHLLRPVFESLKVAVKARARLGTTFVDARTSAGADYGQRRCQAREAAADDRHRSGRHVTAALLRGLPMEPDRRQSAAPIEASRPHTRPR